jgi:predicted nucleic acid-binding protein
MTTFLDSNAVIYFLDVKSPFHKWAKELIIKRQAEGPLIISDIVYSEVSVSLDSVEATDAAFNLLAVERMRFTKAVLFRAGKAFVEYRRRGGMRTRVLSDFLIGAQAEIEEAPLMTADRGVFSSHFPSVELIEPPD